MSVYQEQFKKYEDLSRQSYVNYFALINAVRNVMVEKPDEVKANAIVMFGFSGNGKSTWIQEFIKSNPNYVVLPLPEKPNSITALVLGSSHFSTITFLAELRSPKYPAPLPFIIFSFS